MSTTARRWTVSVLAALAVIAALAIMAVQPANAAPGAKPAPPTLDVTEAISTVTNIPNGGSFDATATCPAGYLATGGGYRTSPIPGLIAITDNNPPAGSNNPPTAWRIAGGNQTGQTLVFVEAHVICSRVTGG